MEWPFPLGSDFLLSVSLFLSVSPSSALNLWHEDPVVGASTPWKKNNFIFCFLEVNFCCRAHGLAEETERDRETESKKSPHKEDGYTTIPSPPVSSRDFGHIHTCAWHEF